MLKKYDLNIHGGMKKKSIQFSIKAVLMFNKIQTHKNGPLGKRKKYWKSGGEEECGNEQKGMKEWGT